MRSPELRFREPTEFAGLCGVGLRVGVSPFTLIQLRILCNVSMSKISVCFGQRNFPFLFYSLIFLLLKIDFFHTAYSNHGFLPPTPLPAESIVFLFLLRKQRGI